jgi:hypothetical protein
VYIYNGLSSEMVAGLRVQRNILLGAVASRVIFDGKSGLV